MKTLNRGSNLLHEAETKLRSLVSEAAAAGDYASVVQLASWARTVSELVNGKSLRVGSASSAHGSSIKDVAKGPKQLTKRGQRSYPVFFRQNDYVVRIAWSKREKKEYRHKADPSILKILAKSMAERGSEGRVFTTEQFLPIHDEQNGEVPNYQAYVGISLLKQAGLIDQHGRRGYSIPRLADFKDAVDTIWKKLPELQEK